MFALLRRLIDIKPEEVKAALWSAAYFFFILAAYYILRPIRDAAGVAGGIRNLPWLFTGTMVAMFLVNPPFAALVAKLPRHRFIPIAYRFFLANLLIFFLLFRFLPEEQHVWVGRVFYIWTSVFNLFVVSVFWGFMADAFNSAQGKRLFGFIGVGGTLGGIVGPIITAKLVEPVGAAGLLLVSAAFLEMAVLCVRRLSGIFALSDRTRPEAAARGEEVVGGGVFDGMAHVFKSPYLLGIGLYMLLYTIGSTFLYFQQVRIVEAARPDSATRTVLFAQIDLAVNVFTVVVQAFFTGRIMQWLGVAGALTVVPVISILGFLGLGMAPSLAVLVAFLVLRRGGNYAVARPSREVLYTVVSREDKYKAKSFI
ncbi:MAG: NTP/NDP exchange transporter, partial [Gemmatimonadales bacterium]